MHHCEFRYHTAIPITFNLMLVYRLPKKEIYNLTTRSHAFLRNATQHLLHPAPQHHTMALKVVPQSTASLDEWMQEASATYSGPTSSVAFGMLFSTSLPALLLTLTSLRLQSYIYSNLCSLFLLFLHSSMSQPFL